jgi:hypothetical protein
MNTTQEITTFLLDENTEAYNVEEHIAINETGIVSAYKKVHTGKDDTEIAEFAKRIAETTDKNEMEKISNQIADSIDYCDSFLEGRFTGYMASILIHGYLSLAYRIYKSNKEEGRKMVQIHKVALRGLKAKADNKAKTLK